MRQLLNQINEENNNSIDNNNKSLGLFNILLLERPGVGKSTLVNILILECKKFKIPK